MFYTARLEVVAEESGVVENNDADLQNYPSKEELEAQTTVDDDHTVSILSEELEALYQANDNEEVEDENGKQQVIDEGDMQAEDEAVEEEAEKQDDNDEVVEKVEKQDDNDEVVEEGGDGKVEQVLDEGGDGKVEEVLDEGGDGKVEEVVDEGGDSMMDGVVDEEGDAEDAYLVMDEE